WSGESIGETNTVRFGTYGRGIWDYELATPGAFPYGNLRGGANIMRLDSPEIPTIGNSATFTVTQAPPNGSGWLLVSKFAVESNANGGTLLVDHTRVAFQWGLTSNSQGVSTYSQLIPSNPALVGTQWFAQAFMDDPQQQGGWAFSNGLRMVIG
ncbi:MAG: hypothetical protein MK213_08960, partial [Planctomycetes bacterium]|nr:hypothetical protein [Planctomycetota bacterium]